MLACAGLDDDIRWRQGERLEHLFEQRCDELEQDTLAVDGPQGQLTYAGLDRRANRLARALVAKGVRPGDRVGLLFDDALDGYVSMLSVLKLHGAYVPLDPGFPPDRIAYIAGDAELSLVLTRSHLEERLSELEDSVTPLALDALEGRLQAQHDGRLGPDELGEGEGELAYLIYTSGTTGRPKGVAITHASICNFVRVAADVYGYEPGDRVYQGLTLAFDFAVEEIWVPWMVGATLVPKPPGANLLGPELHEYLVANGITALCCVPTLLGTIDEELPDLRFLLVSGESCPQDLVFRWAREGRRFLNVYGPTEATVTATWTVLDPQRSVTIGVPLPTYYVLILDPEQERARELGEEGEIGIAGIGLARGYLGQPEKTARAFVEDFIGIEGNPSGRIYRTGDLGRVNEQGELEHLGRIDTQVKIRGYRIELEEIEVVVRGLPGVKRAVVDTHEPEPGMQELVAYYTEEDGRGVDHAHAFACLREKLPPYMVPVYLERLEQIPMMPSGKVDRKQLPEPSGPRQLSAGREHVEPESELERLLAGVLASVLGAERVSVRSNFFDELGASSLVMARFSAELRRRDGDVPAVSMRDIYLHPTIRELAAALDPASRAAESELPSWSEPELTAPTGTPRYWLCGALQLLVLGAYLALASVFFDLGGNWLSAGHGIGELYLRAIAFGAAVLVGISLLAIAAKWAVMGRFRPRSVRIWSLGYVRFWLAKTLVIANPLVLLLVGTPWLNVYLRLLGARVGKGVLILTRHIPVCADLIAIGAGSVIRRETYMNGYRARAGTIEMGPVVIGENVLVGERDVLDIHTTIEDGAQLGHSSALQSGQVIPAGGCWHGSPAQPAEPEYDYRTVPPLPRSRIRPWTFSILQMLTVMLVLAPLEAALTTLTVVHASWVTGLGELGAPIIAAAVIVVAYAGGLLIAGAAAQLLGRALTPGKAYPVFGFHHGLQLLIRRLTNITWLTALFGDSAAITHYLQYIGYRLGVVEQTGTNFGLEVRQDVPALSEVGTGTMVSDGLWIMNAEFSSTSFRVAPVKIGARNYLGNGIVFPPEARTGENCLLATKAMIPIAGPLRENTGLLGSPCFEIPRTVERDAEFEHLSRGEERRRRLAAKTRHNIVTMGLYLLVRFAVFAGLAATAIAPFGGHGWHDWLGSFASIVLDVVFLVAFFVLVERAVLGFRAMSPQFCSIYQPYFWRHERFWKVPALGYLNIFNGTPFKGAMWRLLGVSVGKRVFDDGARLTERTLVSIGDEACLNAGAVIQGHSLEEGTFKSDHIEIGARATVGVSALVHYGTTLEPEAVLEADSFLMKGSCVSRGSRWRGNPANEVTRARPAGGSGPAATNFPSR